jgi:CDP-2,3-bis-(O-geranylgeranyl)-sn-glycerol synthase
MGPVFASHIPFLDRWNTPMDFGKTYRGKRIFGDHKTWRGLLAGAVLATIVLIMQRALFGRYDWAVSISLLNYQSLNVWLLGTLMGGGALLGDAIESFFKRQRDIAPGGNWFPFDQIDFVVGGLILSAPLVMPRFWVVVAVFLVYAGLHPLVVYVGYLLGLRDKSDLLF